MLTEFEFIRKVKKKYALDRVGDDCAVLPQDTKTDLVITADLLVEDIDFRLGWTTPKLLGHKALAVSLSDIAAMGATPKWAMLSVGVPTKIWRGKFLDKFYEGWFELAKLHDVELVGGDVSRTPEKIVVDSIVGGIVAKGKAIRRSGARRGDSIFVTGALGGASAGLALLESGERFSKVRGAKKHLIARQLSPTPRVEIGKLLSKRSLATSMIDISDGLSADLYHLCEASNVGAQIKLDRIPMDKNLTGNPGANLRAALAGGEDFELLFTSKEKLFPKALHHQVTRIGEITSNVGVVEIVDANKRRILPRSGYRHF